VADALSRDVHYTVDEKQKSVLLTEDGYEAVEDVLQVPDLYDPRTQWASYIINALKAGGGVTPPSPPPSMPGVNPVWQALCSPTSARA
jgi:hypothetical protein